MSPRPSLTPRLAELLAFIRRSIEMNSHGPSYTEMATAMGLKSRGAVAGMVARLEDRGFIRRIPGSARSIAIIETDGLSPELEARVSAHCRNAGIPRHEFDKRAAERELRARP